jgi:hypothetical protein
MPEQLCNRPQIYPGHNKSTGKRMAVAMPGILMNLRLFESSREPSARPLQGIAGADRGKAPARFRPAFPPCDSWSAGKAMALRGMVREPPFLVRIK